MSFRFLHAADIHLGFEQYNLPDRARDFANAYLAMTAYAVAEQVDFVLVAGDLFHRSSADAWMMRQAQEGLRALRRAGIPVVMVEGNHDAVHARKHLSWLQYLNDEELLILLNIRSEDNGYKAFVPWDEAAGRGSWIDLGEARVYGMKYYGAATARILETVRDTIEPGPFTILMLHAGIEGQVPNVHGGLTPGQLAPLHPPVDYLALGHVHKRLEMDGWVYNPGSTETNSMEEFQWRHGFFVVDVDLAREPRHIVRPVETPNLRPFHRIAAVAEEKMTPDEFTALAEERIAAAAPVPTGAVIELMLSGVAAFNRQDVPVEQLKSAVELRYQPLVVRARNNIAPPGVVSIAHGERLRRAELERQVVEQLIRQESAYRDHVEDWARLVLDVKNMVVEGTPAAGIVEFVENYLASTPAETRERAETESSETESDETALPLPPDELQVTEPAADVSTPELPATAATSNLNLWLQEEPEGGEAPCLAPLFEDW